jgi:hypothetical protein
MTIELCKIEQKSGESEFIPICTTKVFLTLILPVAKELKLEMIECLPALTIKIEFKEKFLSELTRYRAWVDSNVWTDNRKSFLESLENLEKIVSSTSLEDFDLSTG